MASGLCAVFGSFTEWMETFNLIFGLQPDLKKKRSRSKVDHSYLLH